MALLDVALEPAPMDRGETPRMQCAHMMASGLRCITMGVLTRMVWDEWPEFFRGMDRVLAQIAHKMAFEQSWRTLVATQYASVEEEEDEKAVHPAGPLRRVVGASGSRGNR